MYVIGMKVGVFEVKTGQLCNFFCTNEPQDRPGWSYVMALPKSTIDHNFDMVDHTILKKCGWLCCCYWGPWSHSLIQTLHSNNFLMLTSNKFFRKTWKHIWSIYNKYNHTLIRLQEKLMIILPMFKINPSGHFLRSDLSMIIYVFGIL